MTDQITITPATPIEQLPAYLTTDQAAAYLQLGRRTIRQPLRIRRDRRR
jgi:hypothetical protein